MNKYRTMLFLANFLFIILIFPYCDVPVPIKEMSLAKMEISRALSVKADKYAGKEIKEAQDKLYECHDFVKKEDWKKAESLAVLSHKKAIEAYKKAIPLLAKDTMEIAEKSLMEADEAYAGELAKSEYSKAKNLFKGSQDYFENKKYYECYLQSIEADQEAKNARSVALGKKNLLKDAMDEVKITLAEAKKYSADKHVPEKIRLVEENLKIADNAYTDLKLKKGFSAIEIAKMNADEAYLKAIKETAKKNIEDAEIQVDRAEKSAGSAIAKDEMDGSKEALENARSRFSEAKYKESLSASHEAKRLAYIVINAKPGKKVIAEGDKDTTEEVKGYKIYKVKYRPGRRDCLWRIAQRYYKNPFLWKKIYKANRDKIKNPHLIFPGMKLKIPIFKKPVKDRSKDVIKEEDEDLKETDKEDRNSQ